MTRWGKVYEADDGTLQVNESVRSKAYYEWLARFPNSGCVIKPSYLQSSGFVVSRSVLFGTVCKHY